MKERKKQNFNIMVAVFITIIIALGVWYFTSNGKVLKPKEKEKTVVTVEAAIRRSINKMETLNNYKVNMEVEVNDTFAKSYFVTGLFDLKNKISMIETIGKGYSNEELDKVINYETIEKDLRVLYQYYSVTNAWTKQNGGAIPDPKFSLSGSEMLKILSKFKTAEEIESSDKNVKKYKVSISSELAQTMIGTLSGVVVGLTIDEKDVEFELEITDNYITKMNIDLKGVIGQDGVLIDFETKYSIIFSAFNTAEDVIIPQDVINNAIDMDELLRESESDQ